MNSLNSVIAVFCRFKAAEKEKIIVTQFKTIMV